MNLRKLWIAALLLVPMMARAQVITTGPSVQIISGGITAADNTANPTSKLPVLAGRANAATPTWTEGNIVPLSVDLSGLLRTSAAAAAASDTTTASTALGALNATIAVALAGQRGATFELAAGGTLVATIAPKCDFAGTATFLATDQTGYIQDPVTGNVTTSATVASAQALTDYPVMCPQGASHAKLVVTAFTSGTANFVARATAVTWPPVSWGVVTTAAPSYTTGLINALSLTTAGALRVDPSGVTQTVDVSDRAARLVGQVEGRAASGAAKAGNPVQVGAVFNTTQPTVTTGQAVEAQATARGAHIVATGADVFNVTVNAALPAGTAVIGKTIQATGCGTTVANQALAAVPTAEAPLFAATTCLEQVMVCNTNATAQTFSLKDNQVPPIIAVNAVSIPGNSCYAYAWNGSQFTSGVRWVAGGTGMTATLWGYQ